MSRDISEFTPTAREALLEMSHLLSPLMRGLPWGLHGVDGVCPEPGTVPGFGNRVMSS